MTSHPKYGAVPPNNSGTGTVIISTPDATATYTSSSVTVTPKTHANVTLASSTGLTYTTGTGYNPVEAAWVGSNNAGTVHVKDLVLDGVSLRQILEERLNILIPNPALEKEWAELKKLGDEYRKLEADLNEKASIWKALQKIS